jgi:ubiquitin carboxyl-terminal hydrolase L3
MPPANDYTSPLNAQYIDKLGFDTSLYEWVDVYSTEDWALEMVPGPAVAVMMLYPLTEAQLSYEKKEQEKAASNPVGDVDSRVWFTKQRIGNACGTIGILHSLMNVPEPIRAAAVRAPDASLGQDAGSWLYNFLQQCPAHLDAVAKAEIIEADAALATYHDSATADESNQTDRGELDQDLITHFVALVRQPSAKDADSDLLYELDGRKKGPVAHGPTTAESFLKDACAVVRQFMSRDPSEMRFTIAALVPTSSDME